MQITIIGAGAWGTALAACAATRNDVLLYGRDAAQVAALRAARENVRYLAGLRLPESLRYTDDLAEASRHGSDLIVIATPVAGLRPTCAALKPLRPHRIIWLCKGFEQGSGLLPHEVVAEILPDISAGVLSGPSFAEEVTRGLPTALTVASPSAELSDIVTGIFHGDGMRIYCSEDMVGAEVGGAVKNVLAIATGIADGLELGMNARAALITRGLSEMMRFGLALGAQAETLMGLTGLGDLILTCTGALSRNRSVGLELAKGKPLDRILAELGHVAEGVRCAATVLDRAQRLGIEMPISEAVCSVMFKGLSPAEAVQILLDRAPRPEQSGLM